MPIFAKRIFWEIIYYIGKNRRKFLYSLAKLRQKSAKSSLAAIV
ncbi:hypothetical protein [Anabaena sp. CCY 9402-a]